MKYRKKPVVIEAEQWHKHDDNDAVTTFPAPGNLLRLCEHCNRPMGEHGRVATLEGGHIVCPGDWIITGIKGEKYPCKPDIFEATYDPVGEDEQEQSP